MTARREAIVSVPPAPIWVFSLNERGGLAERL